MATYKVTSPDGQKWEVNAPDDATEQEVIAYARRQFGKEATGPRYKVGVEGLPDATKEAMGQFNPLSKGAIGAYSALDNAAMRLKQLVTGGLSEEEKTATQVNRAVQTDPAAMAGNIVAQAGALGPLGRAATLPGTIAANAAVGGGAGYLMDPELEGESAAQRAGMGAMLAGGAAGAMRGLGGVMNRSPNVDSLLKEGVVPTPGQAAGQGGVIGRTLSGAEEKLTSLPIVVDIVKGSRRRAIEEFNKAAIERGAPKGAEGIGRAGIEAVRSQFDDAYRALYGGLQVSPTKQFSQAVTAAKGSTLNPLSKAAEKQFEKIVSRTIFERAKGGTIPGELAKQMDSDLGKVMREYRNSSLAQEKAIGDALAKVQEAFRDMVRSQAPKDAAAKMAALDKRYANFVRAKEASKAAGAVEGVFTPAQYASAVRRMGKGTAPIGQDLADAGKSVLQDRIPNSGSIDRLMLGAGLAGAAANQYYGGPGYLSALLAAPAIYSRTGARFALGDLPLQGAARAVAPYVGQAYAAKENQ